jgi:hypothetical protein
MVMTHAHVPMSARSRGGASPSINVSQAQQAPTTAMIYPLLKLSLQPRSVHSPWILDAGTEAGRRARVMEHMSFRYYIYVSDAKVDMLLPQLNPSFRRKRTVEWNLNLKMFGAKRGTETTLGDNRISRLEAVVKYLEDHGDLGSVDRPGQFFRGSLPMRWGPAGEWYEDPDLFYFAGSTDETILGLVGSTAHVIGVASDRQGASTGYAIGPLIEALRDDRDVGDFPQDPTAQISPEQGAINAVHYTTTIFPGPEQNLEFIAKRLIRGKSLLPDEPDNPRTEKSVLLGTPLYVAQMD